MSPFLARWPGSLAGWLAPFAAVLALALAGCHDTRRSAADERRVFRYNQPEALTSLDPAFARNQANSWAVAVPFMLKLERLIAGIKGSWNDAALNSTLALPSLGCTLPVILFS